MGSSLSAFIITYDDGKKELRPKKVNMFMVHQTH